LDPKRIFGEAGLAGQKQVIPGLRRIAERLDDPLSDVSHNFLFDFYLWLTDSRSCFAMKIGSGAKVPVALV
jgi:hypothetical protein